MIRLLHIFLILTFSGSLFIFHKVRYLNIITFPFRIFNIFHLNKTHGVRLCNALAKMGPSAIKLGQLLSTRDDIVGTEIAQSLSKLQDSLPPFSYKIVKKVNK